MIEQARQLELQMGKISSPLLQRKFKISHDMAMQIIGELLMEKHIAAREYAKQVKEELGIL
jgi:hypothetical protein